MESKVAIVTGSSKGIGQNIAVRLGYEGYYTFVTYFTDIKGGQKTVSEIIAKGGKAELVRLDVREEDSVRSLFEKIENEFHQLNVLVNNAVVDFPKPIEMATFEEWKAVTRTKIDGYFLCTKYALPLLKNAKKANLIFISSGDGERPNADYIGYSVGVAGTIALARGLAPAFGKYGIRTNLVSPGTILTHLWDDLGGDDPKMWEEFSNSNPMGRVPIADDVSNAVMMLINDPSEYLNGNTIYVNGGTHLK